MSALARLVADELGIPVDPRVTAMAEAIAARFGPASRAVLFYGSCLREANLDGLMLDFYLIVSDYPAAYGRGWKSFANRVLPPNVFPFEYGGLAAKIAVLSEADFHRLNGPETRNVSVWARFAQPSRLVWRASDDAHDRAIAAVARAAPTLLWAAQPLCGADSDPLALWRAAFALTYGAELRAERNDRSGSVVDADAERYRAFTEPALAAMEKPIQPKQAAERQWARRRREGKLLTLARLAKATTTYAGGVDYLAWKISRHSGRAVAIQPWQRRHPILGALTLLPRLIRSGAIR
ncbi:hypothetical protein FSZ31_10195 [Sphingorhabdus soli]|uniref:Phosphatidate cytidylyltransferase n=1 Tax=Flavisphingopyxis soli TaxID=2601267 RepID=A0A5C6U906_9SPHN|nr:hypothetical protein [Sphingorhabdus soli]TXC68075.1 hypothetical protein FSZ31_10195 [Sphingorhabdus soli]